MAFTTGTVLPLRDAAARIRPRSRAVLAAAILFGVAAVFVPDPTLRLAGVFTSAILLMSALWIGIVNAAEGRFRKSVVDAAADFLAEDATPTLLTGRDGDIQYANRAAMTAFSADEATTLAGALNHAIANPGPILYRLESRAQLRGSAQEDVVTRAGHLRIGVHRAAADRYVWRIEKSADRPAREADPVPLPMLTAGRGGAVLFMNTAARQLVGERVRTLDRIFPKMPLRSGQINDITTAEGLTACLVVELEGVSGRREIFLLPGVAPTERQPDGWAFFDELPVPLLKLARSGEVQISNRPARDLLGVEGCCGKTLSDLMEGLGRSIPDWLEDAAQGRGGVHSEFLRVRSDDRETFVQVTLNRATEAGETVLSDATKLKSLEEQFAQSQKMQAIGQLAGGVAHDFNNLLTAIAGHCDLLLLRHDQGDPDYGDLIQINQNANRAAALVSQLLAYSRKQTLRPEVMDLRDMLSDLTHLLNRLVGERVILSLSHDPTLWSIRADKRQLEQVLMNLVVNARDAMPEGGDIRIATENVTFREPLRRDRAVVAPGRYVRVTVSDEGVGIAPDKIQKVFEPFFTTKRTGEGTGLGLSTAYGIVKQTGGFIFADSAPEEGTTFQVLLPAHESLETQATEAAAPAHLPAKTDGVVLLVEDEAPVRAFASRALELRGLTVLEADSAEAALELLEDPTLEVDVFVSDVVMPGIDGPTWVLQALADRPETRVVFMSGYAEEAFGEVQSRIPDSGFLPKPFSLTELTEMVQHKLNQG
ncbi:MULTISPECIES: hybrid sensor histidine kinase/response regulator [unclassified Roseovarius]|uniref:hybrid sensor histidine kinase/response regulator n=1 Tax=unclassified Roseovarius TaxID=2614913 RepID=UPI00273E53B9|nr:ATP-binding protein [Roseovarius sp. MMSF_3350]